LREVGDVRGAEHDPDADWEEGEGADVQMVGGLFLEAYGVSLKRRYMKP
jgi:hypothetical protein